MRQTTLALLAAATLVSAMPAMAQQKRVSPHETVSAEVDKSRVILVYGRPYTKDPKTGEARKIWGGLVPFGKVWRTGADEATLLVTGKALKFGDVTVPAGAYSLFTLPTEDGKAKLIISKQLGEWGAYTYDEKQDLARIDLAEDKPASPVDEFTMSVEKAPSGGGVIKMKWEDRGFAAPFTVEK